MYYHGCVGKALRAIADCPHPTLALIQGACIGGGLEIAGQCDLRIAGESARFGAPINRAGFSMYPEEMAGLLRLIGPAVVLEILLEGRIFSATEALQKGLLTRVVGDAQLEDEVAAAARRISDGAPLVARWHKQWAKRLQQGTPLSEEELRASFAFLDTRDYQEGISAFLEKRKPFLQRPLNYAPSTPQTIFTTSRTNTPANTRFSVATGNRCASLAPTGAISILISETSTSPGR
jgi:enoyl-CoA hydratase